MQHQLTDKLRYIRQVEPLLRGTRDGRPCGLSAAQLRTRVDASYRIDGDPSQCEGWAQLTTEDQAALAADYEAYLAYDAAHGHAV